MDAGRYAASAHFLPLELRETFLSLEIANLHHISQTLVLELVEEFNRFEEWPVLRSGHEFPAFFSIPCPYVLSRPPKYGHATVGWPEVTSLRWTQTLLLVGHQFPRP